MPQTQSIGDLVVDCTQFDELPVADLLHDHEWCGGCIWGCATKDPAGCPCHGAVLAEILAFGSAQRSKASET